MKFKIVYDKPGRIRFRCGGGVFDKTLESAVHKLALTNSCVISAEVHCENGGILVYYKKGHREEVIKTVSQINPKELAPIENGGGVRKIDTDFKSDICRLIVKRFVSKAILPVSIGNLIVIAKGLKYICRAVNTLGEGRLNVDVLDGASVAACLAQKNYTTAGTIMFMLSVSALLEDYTKAKTKAALTDSLAVKTDKVWLVTDKTDVLIPMKDLKSGDIIRIRTGSVIPVDGEVTEGEAYVNEASMTGEPLNVMKSQGATVFAGTVVEEGSIAVRVRELSGNTKIQKIIELIDNSENLKASVQSRAENLADSIVPFSFLGFGLTLLLTRNVTKAVSILMVDYSCAIKLSTPISVISAIREAADHDITVKGGKYLEEFALADSVVFDKTGTLTNAEPVLERVISFGDYTEDETLKIAACLEEHFPHSVARAIVKGASDKGIDHIEEHAEVQYIVAHGIATELHNERAVVGSRHFVSEDEGVTITEEQQTEIDEKSGACSVVYLAIGGKLAGALCISDPPRAEAKEAVARLKKAGIKNIIMLTGDSLKAAEITAEKLGITEYRAQVLPEDKHSYVEKLKADGRRVIMVGDGINDAPALAAANVSVAMSDASDVARETADITLRSSNLSELAVLRTLSERLMERINRNYRFIVGFNSALLISGLAGIITPSMSAFLHNASTMAICAKSMTTLIDKSKKEK
ncbi:MAG: heavy metal translocating P-type ATPase [Ruminococcus sp.]|nr:heavy metal translocating P-type ATPase [Ruminococcus sp.]